MLDQAIHDFMFKSGLVVCENMTLVHWISEGITGKGEWEHSTWPLLVFGTSRVNPGFEEHAAVHALYSCLAFTFEGSKTLVDLVDIRMSWISSSWSSFIRVNRHGHGVDECSSRCLKECKQFTSDQMYMVRCWSFGMARSLIGCIARRRLLLVRSGFQQVKTRVKMQPFIFQNVAYRSSGSSM